MSAHDGVRRRVAGRALAAVLAGAVLAGCSGAGPAPEPEPPAPPATAPVPTDPAERVCAESAAIAGTVDQVDAAAAKGPVLFAGVALLLIGPRDRASAEVDDPELAAALEELIAAIDDLDAQSRAALPEGGNAVEDPVTLDTSRVVAAAEQVEATCAAR